MTSRTPIAGKLILGAFAVILCAGAIVNVGLERSRPSDVRALQPSESDKMIDVAAEDEPSLLLKVGFALTMRSIAQGGELVVPPDSELQLEQLTHLADMTVRVEEYDSVLDLSSINVLQDLQRIDGYGRLRFSAASVDYSVIWIGPLPAASMRYFTTEDGRFAIVDSRVLEQASR